MTECWNFKMLALGVLSYAHLSVVASAYASVCMITDIDKCGNDVFYSKGNQDYSKSPADQCMDEGYRETICSIPYYLYNQCPYSDLYFKECRRDNNKACTDLGYSLTCPSGYIQDTSLVCPYENSYKKCKCDPCSGYDYTYTQAIGQGYVSDGSCNSCGTVKYKRKENPCSGYKVCDCGTEIGASSCYSGNVQKFNSCKNCCEYKCSLTDCPIGTSCSYESCSDKYCAIGCAFNYTNWCKMPLMDCIAMGYKSPLPCESGVRCPYGNYWYCY